MYDKLKRVFAGKPWTQKQIANWERTRGKGRAKFVAWFTLWLGTMMVVGWSLAYHYLTGVPFSARGLLAIALIWYTYGILMGLFLWTVSERKYRENLNAK
jgi:polyferredoxin